MSTDKATKICATCKVEKPVTEFGVNNDCKDGLHYYCKSCWAKRRRETYKAIRKDPVRLRKLLDGVNRYNKRHQHKRNLRHNYDMSVEQYQRMLTEQGGLCVICRKPEKKKRKGVLQKLSVDHCHTSGRVRGLLCSRCNLMIGMAHENPEILARAIDYLKPH
jgi:hypothetical protein